MATVAASAPTASKPPATRLTGVLAALVVLGVVLFALPPSSRLWVAGVIITMALLVKGGDAANIINSLRVKVYGG